MKKLTLPTKIETIAEAKTHLDMLHNEGLAYHCEDDAVDCLKGLVTQKQCKHLNKLMDDIYGLNKNVRIPETFDPCGYLLDLINDKPRFKFIGYTPSHGSIYQKGTAQLVIYKSGEKKYWPNFKADYKNMTKRNKKGLTKY